MEIYEAKDKIVELLAAARVVVQKFGHTKKFAKHAVAFVIKQHENFKDIKLVKFLRKDPIGRVLGYDRNLNATTFSKVRERMQPEIMEALNNWIVEIKLKGRQLRLISQDSSDILAYSRKDKEARWGHRTPSRKEQLMQAGGKEKELFFGYKLHAIVDVETEMPVAVKIVPANTNDKKLFPCLYGFVRENFGIQFLAKFLADAQYNSSRIRSALRDDNMIPLIPFSKTKNHKREDPKDPDYGKRWSVEHVFSRLKEMFGMAKNRFVGLKKVRIHVYSCLLANLLEFVM